MARGELAPRLSLVSPKVIFSILSPMEIWFLATVASGLLSWIHFNKCRFNNRHILGPYRGLNQSEIVKGGHPPPLIGRGPDIPVKMGVLLLQTDRERER